MCAKLRRLGRLRKVLDPKRIAMLHTQGVGWERITAGMGRWGRNIDRVALEGSKPGKRFFGTR